MSPEAVLGIFAGRSSGQRLAIHASENKLQQLPERAGRRVRWPLKLYLINLSAIMSLIGIYESGARYYA